MEYIAISIIGVLGSILMREKWSRRAKILFILFILTLGLLTLYVVSIITTYRNEHSLGPNQNVTFPWLEIGLYFSMLAGMVAKYLFDSEKQKELTLKKRRLWRPILVSPIVFGVIYTNIEEGTSALLLVIAAFQNGFFWQTVLNRE